MAAGKRARKNTKPMRTRSQKLQVQGSDSEPETKPETESEMPQPPWDYTPHSPTYAPTRPAEPEYRTEPLPEQPQEEEEEEDLIFVKQTLDFVDLTVDE